MFDPGSNHIGIARVSTGVLPEVSYAQVFQTGTIDAALAEELQRRRAEKQGVGHIDAVP